MARQTKTITTVIDDLTGETLDSSVRSTEFTYRGKTYSLDLGPDSVKKLDAALKPFMDAAHTVSASSRRGSGRGRSGGSSSEAAKIRAWGIEKGLVAPGSRGRLAREVIDAYNAEHGS